MPSIIWENRSRALALSLLGGVSLLGSGCKLLKGEGDAAAEEYGENRVPLTGEVDSEGLPTFENATEAIVASRSKPASPAAEKLESMFKSGDYAGALSAAKTLASGAEPGSEDMDAGVFVQGASLYYLGRHDEAQAPLDRHRSEFPSSRYKESAQYYQGSNLVKQSRWRAGGQALDGFINRYPESLLMEFALYDRATIHYAVGEYDKCLAAANRIDKEFLYSKIRDRAGVLKGDVLRKKESTAQAEAAYLSAKNLAESYGHPKVAARALRALIEVSATGKRYQDSVTYYQTFFSKYPESSQAPAAALAGLPALKETGKLDDGLDRMENVLLSMPEGTSPRKLNDALRTYAEYYRGLHGPDELMKRYGNLSSTGRGSKALREQLIIARLEVLETYFPERSSEISVFYDEIRARFDRRELSTPTVLKIAKNMVESEPSEAAAWFREVLSRPGSVMKAEATLGLAKTQAVASSGSSLVAAEAGFRKVLDTYGSPASEEEATLGLARVLSKQAKWAEARDAWAGYVNQQDWTLARDEAENGFTEASSKAGNAPAKPIVKAAPSESVVTPVKTAQPPAATNRYAAKLIQAERMIEKGLKPQAFEVLKKLHEDGEKIDEPDAATKKAVRRAGILKEDLGLELGMD